MNDPEQRGQHQVYETADGGAYAEATPGAGPRHHDDVPLTPGAVERKAHGEDPTMGVVPGWSTPGDGAPHGFLVVVERGGLIGAYSHDDADRAHAHARNVGAVLLAAPTIADYR